MLHWGLHSHLGLVPFAVIAPWITLLIIWSFIWKGLVLWVTARRRQGWWFVAFLIINTAGVGEILYLLLTDGFKELQSKK